MTVCLRCLHPAHDGAPCAGDPPDRPYSSPSGAEDHVPQGCPCGDPEFDDDADEGRLYDGD